MALDIVDRSYSGTYSSYFIMQATYSMDTVDKALVHIVGDIKKRHTIGRMDYKNPLRPNQADPTPSDENPFTFDGRELVPKVVAVYEEFNPRDFEENQVAEQLSSTIIDREVPQEVQSQLVQMVLNRAGEQTENGLWMGSTDYAGAVPSSDPRYQIQFYDGYIKKMLLDPLVRLSSISPVTVTTSNVQTIMDDMITQATKYEKALITDKFTFNRMKFLMSPSTGNIYGQSVRSGTDFKGTALDIGTIPNWGGYAVETVAGMPDNTIIFTRATDDPATTNLYVGMNSMEDWVLKVERKAANSEKFFIQGKWKYDVNFGWANEIFLYTTLTITDFQP